MKFAHRAHRAFVNLDVGESMRFRLPPMTAGVLLIRAQRITIGVTDVTGDHSAGQTPSGEQPRINFEAFLDLNRFRTNGRVEPGSRASFMRVRPVDATDPTILDPEGHGGTAPAPEIVFELMVRDQVVQEKTGTHIFFEMPNLGEFWSLRISRRPEVGASTERRRYRIDAEYPGVLPLLDRRIPMRFLKNGFELNWNRSNYLEMLRIENKLIQYRWDEKLAALYDLQEENTLSTGIDDADFPAIEARSVRLDTGFFQHPVIPPATFAPKTPYVSLHIDFECLDSTEIDVIGPDNITLPRRFFAEVRLHITSTGGIMMYDPHIVTSLQLEEHILWVELNFEEKIRSAERTLFFKQWALGHNFFDEIFRPWFVGHYEVVQVEYDEPTDEMVIWHVGKPLKRELTAVPVAGGNPFSFGEMTKLFADAEDERLLPSDDFGGELPLGPIGQPTTPGNLAKVDHIIVLMQENRSFDQVFGYLSRDGIPGLGVQSEVEGLLPGDNQRDVNEVRLSPISEPLRLHSTLSTDTSWPFGLDNPCHGRDCVHAQMTGGMKSFVANYASRLGSAATRENLERIMAYHGHAELPVYAALAREFVICDHWFGSHIGGTFPNRHVMLSGDLNRDRQDLPEEDNSDFKGYAPSERLTFFDHLTSRGVGWKVYEHGYSFLRLYRNFTFDISRIVSFNDDLAGFERDAANNVLPSVCLIEPDYIELPDGNDDHAPADMKHGQHLVARIVRALIRGGQWEKSMLIITYDEHGGFYDHLFPPDSIEISASNGTTSSRPIPPLSNMVAQLGPRVPAIVVSPFVPRGEGKVNVSKTVYEHASIPATILRRFCSPRPPRLSPRVSSAADLRDVLVLDQPRPDSDFASLLQILDSVADSSPPINAAPAPGDVPMRKLPAAADADKLKEDFHGFIAFASSITGRQA